MRRLHLKRTFVNIFLNSAPISLGLFHKSQISRIGLNSLRPSDAYMHRQSSHHWFRKWLVAWSAPSHYLNQWWNIVDWNLTNKLQWNFNRNSNIFIQYNALENIVCEMPAILSRPQCVKPNGWHIIIWTNYRWLSSHFQFKCEESFLNQTHLNN